jgi:hypothetical protein
VKKPPPTTTRKPHRPPKPNSPSNPAPGGLVSVHSRPPPGHGGGGKHGGTGKHHSPRKHKPPPKRKLALGEAVACCSAEALAASLRLAGQLVSDEDVLALYWRTAASDSSGATILDTLDAAAEYGLGGVRLASFGPLDLVEPPLRGGIHLRRPERIWDDRDLHLRPVHAVSVVIGLELSGGPHALALDPCGAVWSWGELWTLDQLQAGPAEEAWAVTWAM